MKTIQLLFLLFLFSNILFGQLPYIEQHISFDQSEYRGMDVVSANDSTLILLGQVNLWNPAFTGIPLYGVPAEGIQVSRFNLNTQVVDSSYYFSVWSSAGFQHLNKIQRLGDRFIFPRRESFGVLACEDDTLKASESNKLGFTIVNQNMEVLFDTLWFSPWCESFSVFYSFTHQNDSLFTSVVKNNFIDSLLFITMNHKGEIVSNKSHYFPYYPNSTMVTHDEKGILLIQKGELRLERFSLSGDFRYAQTGLMNLAGGFGRPLFLALGNGEYIAGLDSLTKIDSLGNTLWARNWSDSSFLPYDIVQLPGSGDLVVAGKNIEPGPDYRKMSLIRFSQAGVFYQPVFYGDIYDSPNSIKILPDGKLVVVGSHLVFPYELDPNPGTFYLLITDPPDQVLDIDVKEMGAFSVFPSPFEEIFQLEYQGYVRGKIGITLYDQIGRKVFEKNEVVSQPVEVYKNMINPGPIPAGMYNLVFRVGDLRIVRRVIKE